MKYRDYTRTISERFSAFLDEIAAEHNFEIGSEFEIALCKTLRRALPSKYGICRGYVVAADGTSAGDDIIIYDHERFPNLRVLEDTGFTQKEYVPIEAAYAYLEAKNSLTLDGDKSTLAKALEQVSNVKGLVAQRERVGLSQAVDPHLNIGSLRARAGSPDEWPNVLNPFVGVVVARHVRESKGKSPLDSIAIRNRISDLRFTMEYPPDLIIAGEDVVGLPCTTGGDGDEQYDSPFFSAGRCHITVVEQQGLAFGVGVCSLLHALDRIRLGRMPWRQIIADAMGVELRPSNKDTADTM